MCSASPYSGQNGEQIIADASGHLQNVTFCSVLRFLALRSLTALPFSPPPAFADSEGEVLVHCNVNVVDVEDRRVQENCAIG